MQRLYGTPVTPHHPQCIGVDRSCALDEQQPADVSEPFDTMMSARPREVAGWAGWLGAPAPESGWSRWTARAGGSAAVAALAVYLWWRITSTMPAAGSDRMIAWLLIAFETLPLFGLIVKVITLWDIDATAPAPVAAPPNGMRVAVFIPTYNEPAEVIAPTIAAACALEPTHETWVLDDGDRAWVRELCEQMGARYVCRAVHDHAKAGNMNHALALMAAEEAAGAATIDIVAVLDCDHVPLPAFLTATLGWFADDRIALVQGPQSFYNAGAFDDDGYTGEQGLFFNVLMPARHHAGAGPFWCGSTSLLRIAALREVGGVATETITEDMHTTLKLIRAGWRTAYHHQTLAVGLAPATPDQYLLQRRRWGMGAMQILVHERLWAAKRWMSWRNFHEYLNGTLWWLEGIATLVAFALPIAVMLSGANTSTATPGAFTVAFAAMFTVRLWGAKRLLRGQIRWTTAFALRVFRIPVGVACMWWLISRRQLQFEVTPKGGADQRERGRTPTIIWAVALLVAAVLTYAALGVAALVPWRTDPGSTVASAVWLGLGLVVLGMGARRIRNAEYATSRRNAHRVGVNTTVLVDGIACELLDISVGGARVRAPSHLAPETGLVELSLPGTEPCKLEVVRLTRSDIADTVSLRARPAEWNTYRTISLWMFHTPHGAVPHLQHNTPVIALTTHPAPQHRTTRRVVGRCSSSPGNGTHATVRSLPRS
jgi:cellulose synthase (UDP-forming)